MRTLRHMIYRPIDPTDFDLAMNIGWYSQPRVYHNARDMFTFHPDLFMGCYDDGQLIGIAYGWPRYIHRWGQLCAYLSIISMDKDHRRLGYGTPLLTAWEDAARTGGFDTIHLGAGPDAFYLTNGYTPIEHTVRIHKSTLPDDPHHTIDDLMYISCGDDPMLDLCIKPNGRTRQQTVDQMSKLFEVCDSGTAFKKEL